MIDMRRIDAGDGGAVISILNYYISTGFHAYPEDEMGEKWFNFLYEDFKDYPNVCCEDEGRVVGFAYLRPFRKFRCFERTAEITYFISPEYTGLGLGGKMLERIEAEAPSKGVKVILANISSLNPGSIHFHEKHGFVKCGEFRNIVEKKGTVFSMVWMQKELG